MAPGGGRGFVNYIITFNSEEDVLKVIDFNGKLHIKGQLVEIK